MFSEETSMDSPAWAILSTPFLCVLVIAVVIGCLSDVAIPIAILVKGDRCYSHKTRVFAAVSLAVQIVLCICSSIGRSIARRRSTNRWYISWNLFFLVYEKHKWLPCNINLKKYPIFFLSIFFLFKVIKKIFFYIGFPNRYTHF